MPNYLKERINVSIGIDTSGSIGQEELGEFLSEVIGIARAYKEQLDMKIYFHDTNVHSTYHIENGSIEKIKQMKIKGGGGTSHQEVLEKMQNDKPKTQVAVFLTDGYSDLEQLDMNQYKFPKIIVLNKQGVDNLNLKNVQIVKIRK